MKTFSAKPDEVRRDWFVVDATDKVLGRLGYAMIKKLKIYAGPEHPHTAQQPKNLEI